MINELESVVNLLRRIVADANSHPARNGYAEIDERLIDEAQDLLRFIRES